MKGCRPLTTEEANHVKHCFTGPYALRNKALFVLGCRTGFRISELLSLTLKDIVHTQSPITIVDAIYVAKKNMKGKGSGRSLLLHQEAREALKAYVKSLGSFALSDALFKSKRGSALTRIQAWRVLTSAFQAYGLQGKLATHSMRKTFAIKIHNALGQDLISTQKALGHANISSTASYLAFDQKAIDMAVLSD